MKQRFPPDSPGAEDDRQRDRQAVRFVADGSARAQLLISGADAAAFVHRLSTQHVIDLKPGDARLAVLTTDKGRVKDLLHHAVVVVAAGEAVLLIGHRAPPADLLSWLDRYFFTEKLTLQDASAHTTCVDVDSVTAEGLVPGSSSLAPWQMTQHHDLVVVRGFDRFSAGGAPIAGFVVVSFGTALPTPTLTPEQDATMRLAAGIPDVELCDAYTPLDLDLHDAIHWAKGCYIGQEVIARLDTYGKQRRHLMGLLVDPGLIKVSDVVSVGGDPVGTVTAVAPAVWGAGLPGALAMLKVSSGGADVVVGAAGVSARVVARQAAQRPHT